MSWHNRVWRAQCRWYIYGAGWLVSEWCHCSSLQWDLNQTLSVTLSLHGVRVSALTSNTLTSQRPLTRTEWPRGPSRWLSCRLCSCPWVNRCSQGRSPRSSGRLGRSCSCPGGSSLCCGRTAPEWRCWLTPTHRRGPLTAGRSPETGEAQAGLDWLMDFVLFLYVKCTLSCVFSHTCGWCSLHRDGNSFWTAWYSTGTSHTWRSTESSSPSRSSSCQHRYPQSNSEKNNLTSLKKW